MKSMGKQPDGSIVWVFALNDTGIESLRNMIMTHLNSKWEQSRYDVIVRLNVLSPLDTNTDGHLSHVLTATRKVNK